MDDREPITPEDAKKLYRELDKSGVWDNTRAAEPPSVDPSQWPDSLREHIPAIQEILMNFADNFTRYSRGTLRDDCIRITADGAGFYAIRDSQERPPIYDEDIVIPFYDSAPPDVGGFVMDPISAAPLTGPAQPDNPSADVMTFEESFVFEHWADVLVKYFGQAVYDKLGRRLVRGDIKKIKDFAQKFEDGCIWVHIEMRVAGELEGWMNIIISAGWVKGVLGTSFTPQSL